MNTLSKSSSVFAEAKQYIPGGVNSPVRSFRSVGGNPPFITRGEGSKLYDLDGNNYIDYVLSYGPLLLGHAHPVVTEAVQEAAAKGTSFGAPTGAEVALAKLVCELCPPWIWCAWSTPVRKLPCPPSVWPGLTQDGTAS